MVRPMPPKTAMSLKVRAESCPAGWLICATGVANRVMKSTIYMPWIGNYIIKNTTLIPNNYENIGVNVVSARAPASALKLKHSNPAVNQYLSPPQH